MTKEYGPIWQLEQNAKTNRTNALTWRNEAQLALKRADEAESEAVKYELAIVVLKEHEKK